MHRDSSHQLNGFKVRCITINSIPSQRNSACTANGMDDFYRGAPNSTHLLGCFLLLLGRLSLEHGDLEFSCLSSSMPKGGGEGGEGEGGKGLGKGECRGGHTTLECGR